MHLSKFVELCHHVVTGRGSLRGRGRSGSRCRRRGDLRLLRYLLVLHHLLLYRIILVRLLSVFLLLVMLHCTTNGSGRTAYHGGAGHCA